MKLDINMLVRQMAAERDIEAETLVDAVAEAISSAARKHYKERNVHTDINVETGEVESWTARDVVEEVEDPEREISIADARRYGFDRLKLYLMVGLPDEHREDLEECAAALAGFGKCSRRDCPEALPVEAAAEGFAAPVGDIERDQQLPVAVPVLRQPVRAEVDLVRRPPSRTQPHRERPVSVLQLVDVLQNGLGDDAEWEGAGYYLEAGGVQATPKQVAGQLWYGFDKENVYLRLDARRPWVEVGAETRIGFYLTWPGGGSPGGPASVPLGVNRRHDPIGR